MVGRNKGEDDRPVFAQALDHLFRTRTGQDGRPIRVEDVSAALTARGIKGGSPSYIWALRSGDKRNPTVDKLQAFADFFEVPLTFFFRRPGEVQLTAPDATSAPATEHPKSAATADEVTADDEGIDEASAQSPGDSHGIPSLATRISRLFDVQRREDGTPWSLRQVAQEVQNMGVPLSVSFLLDLRRGSRDNPTKRQIECLATVFQVRPDYFFGDDTTVAEIDEKLRLLNALNNPRLAHIALRANNLSQRDYRMISALIDSAALDEDGDSSSPGTS